MITMVSDAFEALVELVTKQGNCLMKIKDILVPRLLTISPESTMAEAEKLLRENRIRHLPVYNGQDIVGIISDRDIHRASTLIQLDDRKATHIQSYKKVSDYMMSPVLKMNINDTVEHLTREMVRMKISSYIIEDDKHRPLGIVTTEDLLLLLLDKLTVTTPLGLMKKLLDGYR
jgi:acetoin utilization protein AcuB